MRTNPPCYDKATKTACPRRYIGCKADCEKYHEWLAIHEAEKAVENDAKQKYRTIEDTLANQSKRARQAARRDYMKERRK